VKKAKTPTASKRLKILSKAEIKALYDRPNFTPEEQLLYFSLTPSEEEAVKWLGTFASRVFFVLQLGYFKAQHQIYLFPIQDVQEDAKYVQGRYFPQYEFPEDYSISKDARQEHRRLILELTRYRYCDKAMKQQIAAKARQSAQIYNKPIYILRELLQYLTTQRWIAPGYSFFQDTIGQALDDEEQRLVAILEQHLTEADKAALTGLTKAPEPLYGITRMKRNPKDFSPKEFKREIARGEEMRGLYKTAQALLPALEISNESIKYYASLVDYYSVARLTGLKERALIYLLCYIFYRYRKFHDNLIIALMHNVTDYLDEAEAAAKERVYQYRLETNQNLPKAGQVLRLFTNQEVKPELPFGKVQTKAFSILQPEQLDRVADYISKEAQFDDKAFEWEHIDSMNKRFKGRLRPILKSVEWAAMSDQHPLLFAVRFLVDVFKQEKSLNEVIDDLPTYFIGDSFKRYLYGTGPDGKKQLLVDRYEFLIYRLLRDALEAGNLFCRDSVSFRSLEDDLIDDEHWADKENLIASADLAHLNIPIQDHLSALEQAYEAHLAAVNERILSGENKAFSYKKRSQEKRWVVSQPRAEEIINHPFFDTLAHVDLTAVMDFANQRCKMMEPFTHVLPRYVKTEADERVIMAAMTAWGTNMGLRRMGAISDIDYTTLTGASDHFLRPETLQPANDLVTNAIAELPIFHHYDLGETVHSSSDGQRFETSIPTFNARHSPKYFGLKKGVVAYTLVANNVPINAKVIGAEEHESHFVYDILYNNTSDIQPTMHSTDSHGTNEVNFAILETFGYQFAPRYRDIYDRVKTSLYGFKHPSQYPENWPIRPIRKFKEDLISDEWDPIQRIMVSLALKTTTQNIIIRKLSSHKRKNRTQQALWEYDSIFHGLYLLDYIDSPPLRRNVTTALNRGENYHQLRRAVSYANFGKLRYKTETDQQIWSECSRLITNCIIFYNATLLSNLLLAKQKQGDTEQVELLKHVSPIAWQHINFYGRYTFTILPTPIDIETLIQSLAHVNIRHYTAE